MTPPQKRIGQIIDDRYEITRLIGRGAMAEVFCARDRALAREVAIKILRRHQITNPEAMQRFRREARAMEMIQHRNVAALHGGGMTRDQEPYLVVELLRGRSLLTVLRQEGPLDHERAVGYARQALEGLAAIHERDIHHRDLKPGNLMLEPTEHGDERVVVIDFGFAMLAGSTRLTLQGHVVGSLSYIAPERLEGRPSDARSDIYAMGAILYEALVGRPPFLAEDDFQLIHAHLVDEPVPPSLAAPDRGITPALEQVILAALHKDPDQRPRSAQQMERALASAMVGPN